MVTIPKVFADLQGIPGLRKPLLLTPEDRKEILRLEEEHNYGVHDCLQKEVVLVILHDEMFRKPHLPEVILHQGKHIFPAVPFPELASLSAITGSPGSPVHFYLVNKYYNEIGNHATLLIGFNLV